MVTLGADTTSLFSLAFFLLIHAYLGTWKQGFDHTFRDACRELQPHLAMGDVQASERVFIALDVNRDSWRFFHDFKPA